MTGPYAGSWGHPNPQEIANITRGLPSTYSPSQVCWSAQGLASFLIGSVLHVLSQSPDAEVVSVTQEDDGHFCEAPQELALVAKDGSVVGPMLRTVNKIADAVAEPYPNVLVDTFAYMATLPAPTSSLVP